MKKIILIIAILLIIFISLGLYNELKIQQYEIKSSKVSNSIKILVISDLHSCNYGENQKELIENIFEISPDAICFTGDIVDDVLPQTKTIELLQNIKKNIPMYYVSGNHEYWSGNIEQIKSLFEEYNVKVLEGENDLIQINGVEINISGIDDYEIGHEEYVKQLDNASNQISNEKYSILLAHRPEQIELYMKYNYDLVISGHAHGGQWRIPYLINGVAAPNQGIFPKYAGGKYEHGDAVHIVSRGLAKESTRVFRFFNRPELVVISILPN